jgi:hypothetical protein
LYSGRLVFSTSGLSVIICYEHYSIKEYGKDRGRKKLLVITPKITKKVKNLSKPNVYFSIDDENITYKGVKGKGTATIIDPKRTVPYGGKIYMKYLGTLDHPVPKMILDDAEKGNYIVLEIRPKFFSTWDFPKVQ